MINVLKACRGVACTVMCVPLYACGLAELGAVQSVTAAQRAQQANGGVTAEKEVKRKIEEATERAETNRAKAISDQVATPSEGSGSRVDLRAGGIDAAMKAADDQSK